MRLKPKISIERFQSYTTSNIGNFHVFHVEFFSKIFRCERVFPRMSRECQGEECCLCHGKFLGWRHRHPDGWSPSALAILKDESGLNIGNSDVCVCEACSVNIRQAVKSKKGEPYQLRWLKNKAVSQCCVPTCKSADIKAEKHEFTWEVICSTIGIATIKSPDNLSLCTRHYQQVYRMLNAKSDACKTCGVLRRHCSRSFFFLS